MSKELSYRSDIDGLRAVAVVPVVFYHAGYATFSGGFVGVDVFFVISGFLITSIIYRDIQSQTFSYRQFYARRVRRLFPALFSVVLASCVAAYLLLLPEELRDFGQSVFSIVLFASNFLFWSESGYFAQAAELKPLLHTWSLAIEEQYYLLFPMFLLAVKRLPAQPYLQWVWVLLLGSFAVSVWSVHQAPDAAFYLLPSRMWELLLGSVLAMQMPRLQSRAVAELLAWIGLGLIGLAVFAFEAGMRFPGVAALAPCLGTALIITSGAQFQTSVTRLLSLRVLVFVGLISYSLYLWHWPIIAFTKHYLGAPLAPPTVLSVVVISVLLSIFSWRYIEQPFRGAGARLSTTALFRAAFSVASMLVVCGLVFDLSRGLPVRLPDAVNEIAGVGNQRPAANDLCGAGQVHNTFTHPRCQLLAGSLKPSILVWGDSHANVLLPALRDSLQPIQRNAIYSVANGCAPLLTAQRIVQRRSNSAGNVSCLEHNQMLFEAVGDSESVDTVVLVARWGFHAQGVEVPGKEGAARFLQMADKRATSAAENRILFSQAMNDTIAQILDAGKSVVVVGGLPEAKGHVPDLLAKARWHGRTADLSQSEADLLERQAPLYQALEQAFAAAADVAFIPLHGSLCNSGTCNFADQDMPLFFDDNHLSEAGVNKVMPVLVDFFARKEH
jgi:peptidoglycan/LPS O-acetylase OafA/YrhL